MNFYYCVHCGYIVNTEFFYSGSDYLYFYYMYSTILSTVYIISLANKYMQ